MTKGNLAIREAQRKGRALRLFKGTGGPVEYLGRFYLDAKQPHYEATSSQTGGGATRKVIIFRLRPLDTSHPSLPGQRTPTEAKVTDIPVEENNTERALVDPTPEPYEAERREFALVQQFKLFMESRHYTVHRNEITPPGETSPICTDVYVKELDILIEAKGSIDRNSIRMAIGQLLDYKRFIVEASVRCAVLLPELPRPDLLASCPTRASFFTSPRRASSSSWTATDKDSNQQTQRIAHRVTFVVKPGSVALGSPHPQSGRWLSRHRQLRCPTHAIPRVTPHPAGAILSF